MKVWILYELSNAAYEGACSLTVRGVSASEDRAKRIADALNCELEERELDDPEDFPLPVGGECWWWNVDLSLLHGSISSPQVLPKCGRILKYSKPAIDKQNVENLLQALITGKGVVSLCIWAPDAASLADVTLRRYREHLLRLGLCTKSTLAEMQKAARQERAVQYIQKRIGLTANVWFTEASPTQGVIRFTRPTPQIWNKPSGRGTIGSEFVSSLESIRPYDRISVIGYNDEIPAEDLIGAVKVQ